jgi:superfamily II DNA/RNA helicase
VRLAFGSTIKPSENVRVQAFEVAHDRKQEVLERLLTREKGRCLVFARTKRGTERLAKTLIRQGFAAAMIHGDRSQSQRTAALAGFQRGSYRILVATDVASRGIHVQDIAHVINYDMPADAESFIHRAGRTGRAGERGVASTLFARDQHRELASAWSARWASEWRGCARASIPGKRRMELPVARRQFPNAMRLGAASGMDRTESACPDLEWPKLPGESRAATLHFCGPFAEG